MLKISLLNPSDSIYLRIYKYFFKKLYSIHWNSQFGGEFKFPIKNIFIYNSINTYSDNKYKLWAILVSLLIVSTVSIYITCRTDNATRDQDYIGLEEQLEFSVNDSVMYVSLRILDEDIPELTS